ncbi:hypothetical protein [Streptomyces aidingensis]|uniref:Uncharacterized protein n=1 Tax=Streptomyces aidingensis TaxID=910347 RepID=A0A1I1V8H0_9ACTN|nr:hypothetical protein [Streptomyces aidingensis]SFD79296.1 hypothetical protein SAMN05421773_13111 [Streptomyces aidingensis]
MARRVLIAQIVFLTGMALALLIKEMPGMVREYRIWRMAGRRLTHRA